MKSCKFEFFNQYPEMAKIRLSIHSCGNYTDDPLADVIKLTWQFKMYSIPRALQEDQYIACFNKFPLFVNWIRDELQILSGDIYNNEYLKSAGWEHQFPVLRDRVRIFTNTIWLHDDYIEWCNMCIMNMMYMRRLFNEWRLYDVFGIVFELM